jgi:tetratricopeptide (TPR) repeat protein
MSELINAAVNVKTPLTLFAILALVLLTAFRTRKVPELFFKLAASKLTRERFAQLLHRFMVYGFAAFVVVCATAVAAQALALYSRPAVESVDAFKSEIAGLKLSSEQAGKAVMDYQAALALAQDRRFGDAIGALEASIREVPTVSAQLTAAYLYEQLGDHDSAKKHAAAAETLAQANGNTRAAAKASRYLTGDAPAVAPAAMIGANEKKPDQGTGLIGDDLPLPKGGATLKKPTPIRPGLYSGQLSSDAWQYYRIDVTQGQTLTVKYRLTDTGSPGIYVWLHNSDGEPMAKSGLGGENAVNSVTHKYDYAGIAFISMQGSIQGSVFRVTLQ